MYAGHLRKHDSSGRFDLLFVGAAVVQSSFTFVWDVLMDWGLPARARRGRRWEGPSSALPDDAAPHQPAWWLPGPRPLLRTLERLQSSWEAWP